MSRAFQVLHALLSHWRRKPLQLFALLSGLMIATALWSGVQALNAQARDSYARAAQVLGGGAVPSLATPDGGRFDQAAFVELRRAGWAVSPIVEGRVTVGDTRLRIMGIEPLTLPAEASMTGGEGMANPGFFEGFMAPPWRAFASSDTLSALGGATRTDEGRDLPRLTAQDNLAPRLILMDIGAAQALLDAEGQISRLLLDPDARKPETSFADATDTPLEQVTGETQGDLDRLTRSFHLNLTAFGLLAFLVGLFIVYSAISLAFEQRLPMLRTLRALGVSARMVTGVMLAELVTLALLSGIAGVIGGYLIASALMPNVAASLGGLYGAEVAGTLSLKPAWWIAGIAISVAGAIAAASYSLIRAYRMPPLASAHRHAWREAQRGWLRGQTLVGGGLLILATILFTLGSGLVVGFIGLAALLVGSALLLPPALAGILRLGQRLARGPLSQWFWADGQQQLSGLSVALMALFLALGANIGVGTMVNGFRDTFTGWLDQRLVADIYFNPVDAEQGTEIEAWLQGREDMVAVLPTLRQTLRVEGMPVEVAGYVDHPIYRETWPLLAESRRVWDRLPEGDAVLLSEQLARRLGLWVGNTVILGEWRAEIVGIYADYGNPKGQASTHIDAVARHFPGAQPGGSGILTAPGAAPDIIADMAKEFGFDETRVIDQTALKTYSRGVFEQTFAVTAALNVLTMLVAGIALFMSLLTLSEMRLPQLAPLWAGGVTRRKLAGIEMLKTLALALFTALLAVPLGIAVAWVLVAVVNVQAFGWRLPLHLFPLQWISLIGLALLTAALAAAWPVSALRRMPPVRLVRVFTDER